MRIMNFIILFFMIILSGCIRLGEGENLSQKQTEIPTNTLTPFETITPIPTSKITPTPTIIPTQTPYAGVENQLIAFQKEDYGDIFIAHLFGHEITNITKNIPGLKYIFEWSPDGKWITFRRTDHESTSWNPLHADKSEIWIANVSQGDAYHLGNCYEEDVFWAPDASYVVLANHIERNEGIDAYLMFSLDDFQSQPLDGWLRIIDQQPDGFFHVMKSDNNIYIEKPEHAPILSYVFNERQLALEKCGLGMSDAGGWGRYNVLWFPDSSRRIMMVPCWSFNFEASNKFIVISTTFDGEVISEVLFEWDRQFFPERVVSSDGTQILTAIMGNTPLEITCEIFDKDFSSISRFDCFNPRWSPDRRWIIDIIKIENQNTYSAVLINPQTGERTILDQLQWLAGYKDTIRYRLWYLQP